MTTVNGKPLAEIPKLWIDSNEQAHTETLIKRGQLADGHDYATQASRCGFEPVVTAQDCDYKFIAMGMMWSIERKAVPNDIESSMKDGRLSTQAQRMSDMWDVEQGILMLQGPLTTLDARVKQGVLNALIEVQSHGVMVDYCDTGTPAFMMRMRYLHDFLNKDDHELLRKPKVQMPSLFHYSDRGLQQRVKTLMTLYGLGEKSAYQALRRFTLNELLSNPMLFMEVGVNAGVVRNIYSHLQIDAPESLPSTKGSKGRKPVTQAELSETVEAFVTLSRTKEI